MTDHYERIRAALAMGPTPAPWDEIHHDGSRWTDICHGSNQRCGTPIAYVPLHSVLEEHNTWKERKEETIANAALIAACDPDTIRELLAERDQLAAALEAARADAERWRTVSTLMTHEHRGDAVGWTLSVLLPGDDPDAAIDATLTQEDHND